jgi:Bacterial antitoxin of ParD toxin-antitoxin type II system and RHH
MGKIDHITAAIEQLSAEEVARLKLWLEGFAAQSSASADVEQLRSALIDGENSSSAAPLDFEAFVSRRRSQASPAR